MKIKLCQAVGGSVGETIEREDGEWLVQEGYATAAQDQGKSATQSAKDSDDQGKSAKAKA